MTTMSEVPTHEATVTDVERATRQELAACYRIVDHLGWTSEIFNHISARIPGTDHILVNPFGLLYSEVTASNLVKVDLDGEIIGQSEWPVNAAGIIIHTTVHRERPDVQCVIHTHTIAGSAISGLEEGLGHNYLMSAAIANQVSYHDFEGPTVWDDERVRLAQNLGDKNLLILRNHGLLACGPSIAEAFTNMYHLEGACRFEFAMLTTGRPIRPITEEALARTTEATDIVFAKGWQGLSASLFDAMRRQVDSRDPSYRD
jgi:ribulose-5-phosphate 4-epimerase/fuculose-1-phosphate aldolase